MIKPIKMYTVICDGCGKNAFNDSLYSGWNDISHCVDEAREEGFSCIEGGHYCPKCWDYDKDGEEVIKTPKNDAVKCVDPKLITSMAMRYRHDFHFLPENEKDVIMRTMHQLWEEVVGFGFYKNED